MENQPRDESRAATVREGGDESRTEAGEFIDRPAQVPTAADSRTPSDLPGRDTPPGAATGTGQTTRRRASSGRASSGGFQATIGHQETRSPAGNDYSSSASPIGQGSNTPVGDEPDSFQTWDAHQPEPGMEAQGQGMMSMLSSVRGMMPLAGGMTPSAGGMAAAAFAAGLGFMWWRRRQARQSRYERMRDMLLAAGFSAGSEMPKMIGKAAAQSRSPWLPFIILPIALWLRERGKAGAQASVELLEPLDLESRSQKLARQGGDILEDYSRRWIRQVDPSAQHGWGWTPYLLTGASAGGAYMAYRRGWLRWPSSESSMNGHAGNGHAGSTLVRDVMTSNVETVTPDTKVMDVARRMRDLDIGSLPVTDGRRLMGMVTDRDLTIRAAAVGKDPSSTSVRDVMSPEVAWVFDHEPAERAASVMRQRQIRRLPVLDRTDQLGGVVALADIATDLGDDRLKGETLEDISQGHRR